MYKNEQNRTRGVTTDWREWDIEEQFHPAAQIVYHCGESERFLEQIPRGQIDLIVTSPPYNLGKEYEKKEALDRYLEHQTAFLRQLVPLIGDRGSLCWQVGTFVDKGSLTPLDYPYYRIFEALGLHFQRRFVWAFGSGLHCKRRFSGRYEMILWFTKSKEYTFCLDDPKPDHIPQEEWDALCRDWERGVWEIPNVKANHCEKTEHPCQFPVELPERCVLALTRPGDLVMDPYAGVGSTLIAAVKHGRRAFASEKERKYVDIGVQRTGKLQRGELKMRPLGKPVFVPKGKSR